ncbi:unnamed protein product [Scytosiphon promiscuus]
MPSSSAFIGLVCSCLLLAPTGVSARLSRSLADTNETSAEWTYRAMGTAGEEPYGPDDWYLGYPDCALTKQSPINIAADVLQVTTSDEFSLMFNSATCNSSELVFQADMAVYQVYYDGCEEQPSVMFQNETFSLLQFHIHSPSENLFGGAEYAADIHMVHVSEAGGLLVVGIMLETSEYGHNVELQHLWDVLGMGQNVTDMAFDSSAYSLLPANPTFATFSGSLTTPPCSEGVRWIVMNEPVVMGKSQLDDYRHYVATYPGSKVDELGNTNRPVQDLNGRDLYFVNPVAA